MIKIFNILHIFQMFFILSLRLKSLLVFCFINQENFAHIRWRFYVWRVLNLFCDVWGLSYKTVSNLERVPNLKRVSISHAFGVTKLERVSKLKRYNFTLSYKSRFKIIARYKVRSGSGSIQFSNGKWNAVTNLHWKMKRLL